MRRQGYYKGRRKRVKKRISEEQVIKLVESHRRKMPMLGGRKLYRMLKTGFRKDEDKARKR